MREEGKFYREIVEALGVSRQVVYHWVDDPDGAKKRARIDSYRGSCKDCGAPTDGSCGPANTPERCLRCAREFATRVARERIIECIKRWADTHGGIPPTATDWNASQSRARGHLARVAEYEAGDWESTTNVRGRFGSWNAAIEAAGFTPRRRGVYGRPGEYLEFCQEIRERYEAGESAYRLAREYGCAPCTVTYRLRKAGARIRGRTEARELARAA